MENIAAYPETKGSCERKMNEIMKEIMRKRCKFIQNQMDDELKNKKEEEEYE